MSARDRSDRGGADLDAKPAHLGPRLSPIPERSATRWATCRGRLARGHSPRRTQARRRTPTCLGNRDNRRRLAIEALEGRQLLTINYYPATATLELIGTAGPDNFSVSKVTIGGNEAIRVQEGNVVRNFSTVTRPIIQIAADLDAGPDALIVAPDVSIPLNARGGAGNDTIQGAR